MINIMQKTSGAWREYASGLVSTRSLDDIRREYPEVPNGKYLIDFNGESFRCDMEPFTLTFQSEVIKNGN